MARIQFLIGAMALLLFSACNKVEGGKIQKGDYVGTMTIFQGSTAIQNYGAELDLEKNTFEVDLKPYDLEEIEGEGTFKATKNEITFNLATPQTIDALPMGTYTYELHNKGKHLIMTKIVDTKRYQYDLILKKD